LNLEKINRVLKLSREFGERQFAVKSETDEHGYFITGTAATGALRRTSMELTRALADLRRPG
jgi:hypothetical protein